MSEHLSPYIKEGFQNPTMDTVFRNMLKINRVKRAKIRTKSATVSSDGSCPATGSSINMNAESNVPDTTTQLAFLQTILTEQKDTADSLMESAKKIGPVAQKITAMEGAYDAAFESEPESSLPTMSGSLQGYTIVFFILSFFAIAIVSSVLTNQATGSTIAALKTFGGFMILLIVSIALITRFG